MSKVNLTCRFDSAKSFYGKAKVEEYEDNLVKSLQLYSYDTLVAIITFDKVSDTIKFDYLGKFSRTTTRHQKEFFRQHGLCDDEIKILMKDRVLIKERTDVK